MGHGDLIMKDRLYFVPFLKTADLQQVLDEMRAIRALLEKKL
jgi:hypothetical protein